MIKSEPRHSDPDMYFEVHFCMANLGISSDAL